MADQLEMREFKEDTPSWWLIQESHPAPGFYQQVIPRYETILQDKMDFQNIKNFNKSRITQRGELNTLISINLF